MAIEPEPANLVLLRENMALNRIHNVLVVDKAVSNYKGKAKLYLSRFPTGHSLFTPRIYPSGDNVATGKSIEVGTDSLDNIVSELGLSRVDFITIDAEGSELEILKGARRTLSTYPNIKLVTAAYHYVQDGSPELPQMKLFLESIGFTVHTTKAEGLTIYAVRVSSNNIP